MDIYELLEFSRIKSGIKNFTKTELGAFLADTLVCFETKVEAEAALTLLAEADVILTRWGTLPLMQSQNLAPLFESARRGNVLTPHDFYLISADISNLAKLNDFLKDKLMSAPKLKAMLSQEHDVKVLYKAIEKIISPNLQVKDSASHELARIRKNIVISEERLTKTANALLSKFGTYLAEQIITKREGHYVIPVKTSYKNKVEGVIYDISNSGQTIFVEPGEIALLNNNLINYQNDELIEINRLLRELTVETMKYEQELLGNNTLLGEVDFIFAKAGYGQSIKGFIPRFSAELGVKFVLARHPLINKDDVIANTYNLSHDKFMIIISGPNAGGKTVSLKTIGLLTLMAKAALMLPVKEEPTLFFYKEIYASIGDEQSLTTNLSTFSSHAKRLGEILNVASANDLVLLDELATGTSPEEGEALALAICAFLHEARVTSVISSHYSRLKEFAYNTPGIINASMAFDEAKLAPLYKYHENVPGRSYGLVVAKRFGISEDVIDKAAAYLKKGVYDFELTIGKLRSEIAVVADEKENLRLLEQKLLKSEAKLEKQIERLEDERNTFLSTKQERLEEEVKEALAKLDTLVKEALKGGEKAHDIINLRHEVAALNKEEEMQGSADVEFSVDDYVLHLTLHVKGVITRVNGDEVTLRLDNGKFLKSSRKDLEHTIKTKVKKDKPVVTTSYVERRESIKPELNLIGMRVDEAKDTLHRYLDQVLLKGYETIRIIHGFGSGALRRAVHEELAKLPFVKSYSLGTDFDGQGGATVVKLK